MAYTPRKPEAWSHSRLEKYKNCPRQFYEVVVIKSVKEQQGEAALWGQAVHKALEDRLAKKIPLPENMAGLNLEPYCQSIEKLPGQMYVEYEIALNKNLEKVSWFGKDVFSRAKLDVLIINGATARVIDHKTGKVKPENKQLKLFALNVFLAFPHVTTCHTAFSWLDHDKVTKEVFGRHQMDELWAEFIPDLVDYKTSFKNDNWPMRESGLCRGWCPVKHCALWQAKK